VTLRDAGNYIDKLPKMVKAEPEWQTAAMALLAVVEHNGPAMFASMAIMKALNSNSPPPARQR
jgi:hypothetical protein